MRRAYVLRRSRAADWARICGGLAVPVLVLAAIGTRLDLIPTPALVPVLVVGFLLALLALAVGAYALTDIWNNGATGIGAAVAGITYALPALVMLGGIAAAAIAYPRLTDVTTNPRDPPTFGASERTRPYGVAIHDGAYPDLVTRAYPVPLGDVYAAARTIVEGRGWIIKRDSRPTIMPVAKTEPASETVGETEELLRALAGKSVMTQSRGRPVSPPPDVAGGFSLPDHGNQAIIEAIAPTPIFGFPDDIVVRLRGSAEGTEVDMRSASWSGNHDLGQNARRIRWFFSKLDATLQPEPKASSAIVSIGR